jgi:hypothetical protein
LTLGIGDGNNRPLPCVQRLTARLLLAPVVALLWGLAPEHAHRGLDHHAPDVVHSHFGPHALSAHTHGTGATVGATDDDDDVVWLDGATLHQAIYQLNIPLTVPAAFVAVDPTRPTWFPNTQDVSAPAHGPPRTSLSFRGPPPSCLV